MKVIKVTDLKYSILVYRPPLGFFLIQINFFSHEKNMYELIKRFGKPCIQTVK